jgi:hypothetical protein
MEGGRERSGGRKKRERERRKGKMLFLSCEIITAYANVNER